MAETKSVYSTRGPESDKPGWISENIPEELAKSSLFVFKVKLTNGQRVTVQLLTEIEANYEKIEEDLARCPAQYSWWAQIYSESRALAALLERRIKVRRGALTQAALQGARDGGVKNMTDKQIASVVEADDILNKMEEELILLQRDVGKLYNTMVAIQMKSDNLRSLAGFKRQEREKYNH